MTGDTQVSRRAAVRQIDVENSTTTSVSATSTQSASAATAHEFRSDTPAPATTHTQHGTTGTADPRTQTCQEVMRQAMSHTMSNSGCTGSTYDSTQGGDHNNHYHLHLHNYLSSHSTQIGMSARMIAVDRAIESLLPPSTDNDDSSSASEHEMAVDYRPEGKILPLSPSTARQLQSANKGPTRLFDDPLAYVLAGSEMVEKSLARRAEVQRKIAAQKLQDIQTNTNTNGNGNNKSQIEGATHKSPTRTSNGRPTTGEGARPSASSSTAATSSTSTASGTAAGAPAAARRLGAESDPAGTPRVAIRTRYFDDFIRHAHFGRLKIPESVDQVIARSPSVVANRQALESLARMSVQQLVLVQCGMDTQAYRLPYLQHSSFTVYELEQASILQYKNSVIQSVNGNFWNRSLGCRRVCVACDLTGQTNGSAHVQQIDLSLLSCGPMPRRKSEDNADRSVSGAISQLSIASQMSTDSAASSSASAASREEGEQRSPRTATSGSVSSASSPSPANVTDTESSGGETPEPMSDHRESRSDSRESNLSSDSLPQTQSQSQSTSSTYNQLAMLPWSAAMLTRHQFDAHLPSSWLLEGNLMYMTEAQSLRVIDELSLLSAPGSLLGFSHINAKALANVQRSGAAWGLVNNTWSSCWSDKLAQRLADDGWALLHMTQLGAPDASYGRWHAPVYALDDPERGVTLYGTYIKVRPTFPNRSSLLSIDTAAAQVGREHRAPVLGLGARPESRASSTSSDTLSSQDGSAVSLDDSSVEESSPSAQSPDRENAIHDAEVARCAADIAAADRRAREFVIDSWNDRAQAYDKLLSEYDLFARFAQRLIDLLPPQASQFAPIKCVDLAAGTGCVSQAILQRFPLAQLHIVEPSLHMLTLARRAVKKHQASHPQQVDAILSCDMIRAEDCAILASDILFQPVLGVLCSSSMHLMNEHQILPQVHRLLADGGVFCYNLLSHSFDVTRPSHAANEKAWKHCVNEALLQCGEMTLYDLNAPASNASPLDPIPPASDSSTKSRSAAATAPLVNRALSNQTTASGSSSANSSPTHSPSRVSATSPTDVAADSIRSVAHLQQCAAINGFMLDALQVDTDLVTADLFIAFNAMNDAWLRQYAADKRATIIAKAREIASHHQCEMQTVRVRMSKMPERHSRNQNSQ